MTRRSHKSGVPVQAGLSMSRSTRLVVLRSQRVRCLVGYKVPGTPPGVPRATRATLSPARPGVAESIEQLNTDVGRIAGPLPVADARRPSGVEQHSSRPLCVDSRLWTAWGCICPLGAPCTWLWVVTRCGRGAAGAAGRPRAEVRPVSPRPVDVPEGNLSCTPIPLVGPARLGARVRLPWPQSASSPLVASYSRCLASRTLRYRQSNLSTVDRCRSATRRSGSVGATMAQWLPGRSHPASPRAV